MGRAQAKHSLKPVCISEQYVFNLWEKSHFSFCSDTPAEVTDVCWGRNWREHVNMKRKKE